MKKVYLFLFIILFSSFSSNGQAWVQKSNFPGQARLNASGFAMNQTGYVFGGRSNTTGGTFFNDLWRYNQSIDSWLQMTSIPGVGRSGGVTLVIDSLVYVGLGYGNSGGISDFYMYYPAQDSWFAKANFNGLAKRLTMYGTCLGFGYVAGGLSNNFTYSNEFWKYDPLLNTWSQVSGYPLSPRAGGVCFTLDSIIYFGLGHNGQTNFNDIWSYNPINNNWVQLPSFPGIARFAASAFTINGKAIVGGGQQFGVGVQLGDYYEYDPAQNTWSQITTTNFSDSARSFSASFTLNDRSYLLMGRDSQQVGSVLDIWEMSYMPTGISEITIEEVVVYPIPASERINIDMGNMNDYNLEIYSLDGRLVLENTKLNPGVNEIILSNIGTRRLLYKIFNSKGVLKSGSLLQIAE